MITDQENKLRCALAFISGMATTEGKPSSTDYEMLVKIRETAERILANGELYPHTGDRK